MFLHTDSQLVSSDSCSCLSGFSYFQGSRSRAGKDSLTKLRGSQLGPVRIPSVPFGRHPPDRWGWHVAQALLLTVGGSERACSFASESDTRINLPSLVDVAAKGAFRAKGPGPLPFPRLRGGKPTPVRGEHEIPSARSRAERSVHRRGVQGHLTTNVSEV